MPDLTGKTILYTRNAAQFPAFAASVMQHGGRALHLPLMDTRAIPAGAWPKADSFIFTSAAAAYHADLSQLPAHAYLIAIGEATAAALPRTDLTAPAPHTSESLLSVYSPQNTDIAIVKGRGGRGYLTAALAVRNRVQEINVYERFNPTQRWPFAPDMQFDAVTIASSQTLTHLMEIAPQNTLKLLQCHSLLITFSARIAADAQAHGFQHTAAAANACDSALLDTLFQTLGAEHE